MLDIIAPTAVLRLAAGRVRSTSFVRGDAMIRSRNARAIVDGRPVELGAPGRSLRGGRVGFPDDPAPGWHQPVIALGNFDGLHRGHMKIIDRVRRRAGERAGTPAAMTFDPLSSQGIYHALESGIGAGRAIGDWLTGGVKPFDAYTEWMEGRFATYLKQRQSYYARERRWPRREFWRRRHAAPQGPSGPSRCESSREELGDDPRADRGAVVGQGYPTD